MICLFTCNKLHNPFRLLYGDFIFTTERNQNKKTNTHNNCDLLEKSMVLFDFNHIPYSGIYVFWLLFQRKLSLRISNSIYQLIYNGIFIRKGKIICRNGNTVNEHNILSIGIYFILYITKRDTLKWIIGLCQKWVRCVSHCINDSPKRWIWLIKIKFGRLR